MTSVTRVQNHLRARIQQALHGFSQWVGGSGLLRVAIWGMVICLCFGTGAAAARNHTQGIMLIAGLFALVILRVKPQRMVGVAIFLGFVTLPSSLHVGLNLGPITIYAYEVAVVLAILFLIPLADGWLSDMMPALLFLLTILVFTTYGVMGGNDIQRLGREAQFLVEMVAGFVLAALIVRVDYVRQSIRVLAVTLWISAGILIVSSLTGLELSGRMESLESETGSEQAIRLLTASHIPSMAALCGLAAAYLLGKARLSSFVGLGVPSLAILVLSFSRNTLIALGVTIILLVLTAISQKLLIRLAKVFGVTAIVALGLVPGLVYLLGGSAFGVWLSDQVRAYNVRVLGGVSSNALAHDSSTLARLQENANLERAMEQAPYIGHGLGYAYQLPFGDPDDFSASLGTTYAHNFYLWWLVKAGVIGVTMFAVFAIIPIVRAVSSRSAPALASAAVACGLLFVCIVDPLPLDPANSLVLGSILGATMAFSAHTRSHVLATDGSSDQRAHVDASVQPTPEGAGVPSGLERAHVCIRVLIVGPAPSGPLSRGGMATVTRLMLDHPDPRFAISAVPTYIDGNVAQRIFTGVRGMIVASWYLLRGDVDVLHVHLSHGGSVARKSLPLWIARAVGVPAVIHGHSFDFAGWFDRLPHIAQRLVRSALPATRWLVLGEGLAREYAARIELPPGRVGVLHNAVRIPQRCVRQDGVDPVRAVVLGRLGKRKGSYDLVSALSGLAPEVRDHLRVTLAGDGEVENIRDAVRSTGLEDVLTVTGWIGPAERDELLGRSQVFVLPSYDEGLPMALLEAMACGLVPIVTPVGSISEAVTDGVEGLLVAPGDVVALRRAVASLVLDEALRAKLAVASRHRAAAFDLNRWYAELGSIWVGLARGSLR